MSFATTTSVPVARTQDEIRKTLERYGATGFMFGQQTNMAMVAFEMKSRRVKFLLQTPVYGKTKDKKGYIMGQDKIDQVNRTAWRCLLLAIKAKLECAESGISTFEQEFLAHIVMPNGQTIGEAIVPQIAQSYQTGTMPPLLGGRV